MNPELVALQSRLQHRFASPRLLERALTHRSFGADHNERLEFLGDSVLNLAVSSLLYERLDNMPEGDLSRVRAHLVKQDTLFDIAQGLGLSPCLRLGDGEKRSGGHKRPSILADALEAVIGAVYLDGGFEPASQLVRRLYADVELNAQMRSLGKDPKTELQEWLQARKMKLPVYRVVATLGEAHKQTFDVECLVQESGHAERGIGASRRAGEQAAAAAMLQHFATHGA
ncbi:MAG: ribonuclease III [Hydrogenophaga sp.]|uniref:ribonuclease III n=1 Tax=Hydrogenophaga sp. TaxID=1904254 RepID=UPI001D6ABED2|nr:ribonuclease III [Hydrogenophaga sp.]MBX3609096.1 ribonuclease III [Hydrogenophaga sp.]